MKRAAVRIPFALPPRDAAPFDIVALGENSVDLLLVSAVFPQRNGKHQLDDATWLPGGQMASAAAICARLGWRTRYVGRFGDDELGRTSRQSLVDEGVEVSESTVVPRTPNRVAVILVDRTSGERTVLWHKDRGLAMKAAALTREAVTAGRMLLVDCTEIEAATDAARYAREAGRATVVDVETVQPGTHQLLAHIDAIIAAEPFPPALTGYGDPGRALEAMAREFRSPLVAMTLGEGGSLALCGGREVRTAGFAIDVVDSTGAGDAFRAGFAAACLRQPEGEIEDVLKYANAVAALNCRGLGARGGIPTPAEVDALLQGAGGLVSPS